MRKGVSADYRESLVQARRRCAANETIEATTVNLAHHAVHRAAVLVCALAMTALHLSASAAVTERVSVASDGTEGDSFSESASVNADGRFVAFRSAARNLVANDTNGQADNFVHDRGTTQTQRVSVPADGMEANRSSERPSISADGRYVAFESWADNLVAGDTNARQDVFVHDRQTGVTERVSDAGLGPSMGGLKSAWYPWIRTSPTAASIFMRGRAGSHIDRLRRGG